MEEKTVAKKYSRTPKRAITQRRERSSVRLTGLVRRRLQLKEPHQIPFSDCRRQGSKHNPLGRN
ncbi:hypothetical protein HPP92_002065 [Vanilla planifolia]|uniref:Uncharacterized protein n=1 Tax=Vanilla planifolia TaxID=51239 RepID=A0A835RSR3_VANPL|nr:hypothetical protein HPP92_002065 [Vanilla planifolia]